MKFQSTRQSSKSWQKFIDHSIGNSFDFYSLYTVSCLFVSQTSLGGFRYSIININTSLFMLLRLFDCASVLQVHFIEKHKAIDSQIQLSNFEEFSFAILLFITPSSTNIRHCSLISPGKPNTYTLNPFLFFILLK